MNRDAAHNPSLKSFLSTFRKLTVQAGKRCLRWDGPAPLGVIVVCIGICSSMAARCRGPGAREDTKQYDAAIKSAADRYMPPGWDWRILKAMIRQESNFKPRVKSRVGAIGLTQVMPATAESMGINPASLSRPETAIECGAKYLRHLWDRWPELPDRPPEWMRSRFAVASYNAGYSRVRKRTGGTASTPSWNRVSARMPEETQIHIRKVFDQFYPAYVRLHPGRAEGVITNRRSRLGYIARLRTRRTDGRM